jgi:RES domain-containing protein
VADAALPENWRDHPPPPALSAIGERWARERRTAILSVPSVVIPHERNFILNPAHPQFARIAIDPPQPFTFDPRMWKDRRTDFS